MVLDEKLVQNLEFGRALLYCPFCTVFVFSSCEVRDIYVQDLLNLWVVGARMVYFAAFTKLFTKAELGRNSQSLLSHAVLACGRVVTSRINVLILVACLVFI